MKAIVQDVYGPADVLELRDIDRPSVGDDEVLVRVRAAGVDPGVWHLMTGRPYLLRAVGFGLRRPKVPVRGRDLAGVVEAVGARRDPACGPGTRCTGPARAAPSPSTRPPGRIGWRSSRRTSPSSRPRSVPISGMTALQGLRDCAGRAAGATGDGHRRGGRRGSFAVQIAKAFGATVTGVCSTAKVDLVRFPRRRRRHRLHPQPRSTATGRGTTSSSTRPGNRPLSLLRRALTPRGTLVLVGGEHGGGRLLGGYDRQMLRAPLVSMFTSQRLRNLIAKEHAADLEELRRLIDSGAVTPVIDRTYPLADAADAIRHLAQGHAAGKTVVTV